MLDRRATEMQSSRHTPTAFADRWGETFLVTHRSPRSALRPLRTWAGANPPTSQSAPPPFHAPSNALAASAAGSMLMILPSTVLRIGKRIRGVRPPCSAAGCEVDAEAGAGAAADAACSAFADLASLMSSPAMSAAAGWDVRHGVVSGCPRLMAPDAIPPPNPKPQTPRDTRRLAFGLGVNDGNDVADLHSVPLLNLHSVCVVG